MPCWVRVIPPMVTLKSPAAAVEPKPARRIRAIRACLMAVPPVYEWRYPGLVVQCLCHGAQCCLVHHMAGVPGTPLAELSSRPTPLPHPVMIKPGPCHPATL